MYMEEVSPEDMKKFMKKIKISFLEQKDKILTPEILSKLDFQLDIEQYGLRYTNQERYLLYLPVGLFTLLS